MRRITTTLLNLACAAAILACAAAATAQEGNLEPAPANPLTKSRVFAYDDMTAKTAANGAVGRSVFSGTLATGEAVGVHESLQPAGTAPNPAHRIHHSEVIVVEEGTLEFDHDGKTERANVGSIIYVAYGTLHQVKNVGDGPAKYVVIQIGGDTRK
jgi:quercetin dioxygenase-like cupin family protein